MGHAQTFVVPTIQYYMIVKLSKLTLLPVIRPLSCAYGLKCCENPLFKNIV